MNLFFGRLDGFRFVLPGQSVSLSAVSSSLHFAIWPGAIDANGKMTCRPEPFEGLDAWQRDFKPAKDYILLE